MSRRTLHERGTDVSGKRADWSRVIMQQRVNVFLLFSLWAYRSTSGKGPLLVRGVLGFEVRN